MKVALVGEAFHTHASLPRAQVEVARHLLRRGHDVHVYSDSRHRDTSLAPGVVFHDVRSPPYSTGRLGGARRRYFYARAVDRLLAGDRAEYDVVHARGAVTTLCDIIHFPGVFLGERARDRAARDRTGMVRRVKDALSPLVYPQGQVRLSLERAQLENARAIHVDSALVRDDLVRHYAVKPERIRVVPTGVNLEEFRPASDPASVRSDLGLPLDKPLILFCGHDFHRKGLDRLLTAAQWLRHPATVVVVGGGDIEGYRDLAGRLGISADVVFVGSRSDAARFYQAADVVAFPTRVDMWGAPVIEAMAAGVPSVTTDAAGAAGVVRNGETGIVLPEPLDLRLFADTLDSLLADTRRRARIGRAARAAARDVSWSRHGQEVEEAMLALAAKSPRPAPSAERP